MPIPDSIVVAEEWISEHYLTTTATNGSFLGRINTLRKQWDDEESDDHPSVRSRLRGAATAIARAANELGAGQLPDAQATRDLHALIREALGYPATVDGVIATRSGAEFTVPDALRLDGLTGTAAVVLQAHAASSVEDILDPSGAGTLLEPATIEGKPESSVAKVVSSLFGSDEPPPFVLVQAGRWVLLAERARWPEGRWLAVDIGLVAERRDVRKAGELEFAAAAFGRDTLLPGADGSVLWQQILEESVQHTVGVSKDLREGIRLSVEILANEVVRRRRKHGLGVDAVPGLAADLTRQSLRFLYRILFVLYAETSAELGVLPVKDPQYRAGYGVDRLRDLTLTQLTTDRTRSGTHLYESLHQLFRLVDRGHPAVRAYSSGADLEFRALRADLFAKDATALIDEVQLGNEAVQQVLAHLLLSKARRGTDRGFISYAELGINQLGAVYEGLMSYTGSFAAEDQYEVAPNGNPEKGTWVLPASRIHDIPAEHLVRTTDPVTGEPRPVVHERGTFVYRLAGRERQQSASYYTPEVLTRSVVSHSLAELLDQDGAITPAHDILRMTVCEPALGSGAFAIEAVRQLAAEYLKRRATELGTPLDPDAYPEQLQRVKAYLALHQVYGVDLNDTAVELAEVSLWLDTMYAGLEAPWFGLHLRRGNSLIGARHAFYSPAKDLPKKAWLRTAPEEVPLGPDVAVAGRVQHFLLPAQGWGAGADAPEVRAYAPGVREELRAWRSDMRTLPSKADQRRLVSIARRVETLWQLTLRRLTIAEAEIRRHIDVWGADDLPQTTGAIGREQIESVLRDPDGAYRRLRRIMDAWCALWFWPATERLDDNGEKIAPPGWAQWLDSLESIVGLEGRAPRVTGQISFADAATWDELDQAEVTDRGFAGAQDAVQTTQRFPWLQVTDAIAREQGFFHWELDFAPVFARGGFDLQLGNPPWVRPMWDETAILAEDDPWWQVTDKPAEDTKRDRRERTLELPGAVDRYLDERIAVAGVSEHLGSDVDRPVLTGLQPDLYRCFMERTWRSMRPGGVVGLIHPESHFTELRAGGLRRETYLRLRRHWAFRNNMYVFSEISDKKLFGMHIYGNKKDISFLNASWIYLPSVVDQSIRHNGSGPAPGVRDVDDRWDIRPHAQRIVRVDETVLAGWAALVDEPGTPPVQARMLYPINTGSAEVLRKLASAPRLGSVALDWTAGWHETADRKRGYFAVANGVPEVTSDVIMQGPHIGVATPLHQEPRPSEYRRIDLEDIDAHFVPRTIYQRAVPAEEFRASYPRWGGTPSSEVFRVVWRRRVDAATVRSLYAALLPPGPTHMNQLHSLSMRDPTDCVIVAGTWASLVCDFFVKATGIADVIRPVFSRFPHVRGHALERQLILRTLRLNCLTAEYEPLWSGLFDPAWNTDTWVPGIGVPYPSRPAMGDISPGWTMSTPLRRDADRRQALVEIDAIVAVMLGITADELATIYRTQFPVLQSYERDALYDNLGRQVPREIAKAYRKALSEGRTLGPADRSGETYTYELPFTGVDRDPDLRAAHAHFSRLAAGETS